MYFIENGSTNLDLVFLWVLGYGFKEVLAGGFCLDVKAEDIFVGIKYEEQVFRSRCLHVFF